MVLRTKTQKPEGFSYRLTYNYKEVKKEKTSAVKRGHDSELRGLVKVSRKQ
jgi:hypothetical protein